MEAPDCLWKDEKKESFFLFCLAVGGLISQRGGGLPESQEVYWFTLINGLYYMEYFGMIHLTKVMSFAMLM